MTPEEQMEEFTRIISLATSIAHMAWETDYVIQIRAYAEEIILHCDNLEEKDAG